MLARKLGVSTEDSVYARSTYVDSEVDSRDAVIFLEMNHIQGARLLASHRLGLRDTATGELVALMLLLGSKESSNYEITRYATSKHVQGGFSKLVAWVDKNVDHETLITFSDNCVSDGKLYEQNGWEIDTEVPPSYYYVYRNARTHWTALHQEKFRQDPELTWEEGLTERQLAELNNIPRIWDAGKVRWKKSKQGN